MNLSKAVKVVFAATAAGAATTDVEGAVIDMQGYLGCAFVGRIAVGAAGNFAYAQQGAASNLSDAADLPDTQTVIADDNDSFLVDVYRPEKRYLRVVVERGTSTATGDIYALLYDPVKQPVAHGATVEDTLAVSPDEGTIS
ncbi:MAG: hypothetical protein R6X32_06075 [Chloroflexota bacterium]